MRTPSLPFLEEMRNAQLVNLSSTDVLEDTPSFETGTLNNLALGVNHMLSTQWSAYGKYLYQHGDSSYEDDNQASGRVSGKAVRRVMVVLEAWMSRSILDSAALRALVECQSSRCAGAAACGAVARGPFAVSVAPESLGLTRGLFCDAG